MMPAIEIMALFAVLAVAVFLYRWLIYSKWFSRLVGSLSSPPPETPEEVVREIHQARRSAWDYVDNAEESVTKAKKNIAEVKRQVRRKPTPF